MEMEDPTPFYFGENDICDTSNKSENSVIRQECPEQSSDPQVKSESKGTLTDVTGTHFKEDANNDVKIKTTSDSKSDISDDMSMETFQHRTRPSQDLMDDDSSRITKRKSGSVSEMTTVPLKKQKPEEEAPANKHESSCAALSKSVISKNSPDRPRIDSAHSSDSERSITPARLDPPVEILNWIAAFSAWTHPNKLLALERLIETCEPQQVRHMEQVIKPLFQRDFILLLPKELALYVLSFLEPKNLLRAAQTCRYWRILAEDNLMWRRKCEEAGLDSMNCTDIRSRIDSLFEYSSWKAGYLKQHRTDMNLRQNIIKDPKVLKGHDDHVITCLEFSDDKIVSGSDDNTLKVWCARTGDCLRTLEGHTGGVWTSQINKTIVVSGSTDRSLKVWNMDSGECLHTLRGHTSTVRCMHLHGGVVVSGSRDATLRMWDVELGECLHVLVGHMAAVRCVQYDGWFVISGGYDYMVKVWNPETAECLHTLVGHTNRVYSLQFDGVHVVSGSLDTCIRVWDVETGACKQILMGHQSLTSGMELRNNVLVSGNADSTVKIWDIITGSCLQTLDGPNKHGSAVTSIQFNDKFVVTSSDDGTVKLWDVKTGEFIRDLVALGSGGAGGVVWRIRMKDAKIVCAVGSRNGTEETKLLVLNFDSSDDMK